MSILERPLSPQEKNNAIDMLRGCINRICVSDDSLEICRLIGSANYYISELAQSRILQLKRREVSSDE